VVGERHREVAHNLIAGSKRGKPHGLGKAIASEPRLEPALRRRAGDRPRDERREKTDEADAIDAAMSRLRGPEDAEEHRCAHEPSSFVRFLGRWRARTLAIRDSPRSGEEEERTAEEAGRKD